MTELLNQEIAFDTKMYNGVCLWLVLTRIFHIFVSNLSYTPLYMLIVIYHKDNELFDYITYIY